MKNVIVLFFLLIVITNFLYSNNDSTISSVSSSYIMPFYNWDDNLNLYGLKAGLTVPTFKKQYFDILFEVGGGFGKLEETNLWGLTVMPGLRLKFFRKKTFLMFDILSGFGYYDYKSNEKGIMGNQTELRGLFGYSFISVGFYVQAFIGIVEKAGGSVTIVELKKAEDDKS